MIEYVILDSACEVHLDNKAQCREGWNGRQETNMSRSSREQEMIDRLPQPSDFYFGKTASLLIQKMSSTTVSSDGKNKIKQAHSWDWNWD
jgi:hypothetical protein